MIQTGFSTLRSAEWRYWKNARTRCAGAARVAQLRAAAIPVIFSDAAWNSRTYHRSLVLKRDASDLSQQREHDVQVADYAELGSDPEPRF